jgi:hypothetical protein
MSGTGLYKDYGDYVYDNYGNYNKHKGFKSNSSNLKDMEIGLNEDIVTEKNYLTYLELYDRVHGKGSGKEGGGGSRRNKATPKPKHDDMTMKDIKELCKANQIKLSKVVDNKRVVFNKKELITKLKRKKLL